MRDASKHWQGKIVQPSKNRYPVRWLKVAPDTGVVLGEYSAVEKPSAKFEAAVIVPATVKR